jgi:putative ABC transport system permease protein
MLRSCIAFAWINLVRGDRVRFAVAIAGAVVAIFILLVHLAFLRAVEHKAAQVYGLFDAEVVMISDRYQFLYRMADFPSARLRQAVSVPGVGAAAAVRVTSSRWLSERNGAQSSLLLIGIDPDPVFLKDADLRAAASGLKSPRRVLFDRRADPEVGRLRSGDTGYIGYQPATVAGSYELGLPMYAAATAIVANSDFAFYSGEDPRRIQLGLLRLAPGTDPDAAVDALRRTLPDDVRVMTRAALMDQEAHYFVEVKPLGIMMKAGLAIGLLVGAVALFQIMSSQIESRMRDFAVLRAMGFSAGYTYAVGAWQLLLMGAAAFAAAWLVAMPVFALVSRKSHLFLPLDAWLLGAAAALCLPMIASAALPLVRAARAEPARLFGAA